MQDMVSIKNGMHIYICQIAVTLTALWQQAINKPVNVYDMQSKPIKQVLSVEHKGSF